MEKNDKRREGTQQETAPAAKSASPKKHIIRPKWLRITLKTLLWIIVAILLIPVLLYIPPVQTFLKNIACDQVYKATGMKVDIDRFGLSFPLDVNLEGVTVLYAGGDTMVRAKKVVADVKILPLLNLDVRINKLMLEKGYYKMVSPDSSMVMKINAGLLNVDDRSSANISKSEILLHNACLRDGDVRLYMNVWKKKPTPTDTTTTPFLIKADDLKLDNFKFAMSMLPTIDTLDFSTKTLQLKKGVIDLRTNNISLGSVSAASGDVRYITPTPEYVKNHPAPVDTVSEPSAPMVIKGGSISLDGFNALYATKGAKPVAGFDPSFIQCSGVAVQLNNFYNEASTVKLPITKLMAKERSGLQIVEGNGFISVDSIGLGLENLLVKTVYSRIGANAKVPFALMAMNPDADMEATADGSLGLPDIEAFMPALNSYIRKLPRSPLNFALDAKGSLSRLVIDRLDAAMPGTISLRAKGYAEDPLDMKKMKAMVKFDGELRRPQLVESLIGKLPVNVPSFKIKGDATAVSQTYGANFSLLTSAGDLAAKGRVGLDNEHYEADVDVHHLNMAYIMPSLGIGTVDASIKAHGAGFNPDKKSARTDIDLDIASIVYNRHKLNNIRAKVGLDDGLFDVVASSNNPALNLYLDGTGTIEPDLYEFNVDANIHHIDLHALGMSDSICNGSADIALRGTASPARWLYDADLNVTNIDWNLPGQYLHIPGGVNANLLATADNTSLNITSIDTDINFDSPSGMKSVVDGFTAASNIIMKQIKDKEIAVDEFQPKLPKFTLRLNTGASGVVNSFLNPSGMSIDSIYADIDNDSIFRTVAGVTRFQTSSLSLDTITLNLDQRGKLLDYAAHVGNRPGTLDEFANVNIRGYLGSNRVSAYLVQNNIKKETGYRLGLTAALMDSTISVHFTPLKATIAYLPWNLNDDNYIDYTIDTQRIEANLIAKSSESSILVQTEPLATGGEEIHLALDNIKIEDFLRMSVTAPPVTASVDADIKATFDGKDLTGNGNISIQNLTYEKKKMGDFDFTLDAAMLNDGKCKAELALNINQRPAMAAYASLAVTQEGFKPDGMGLKLIDFPLDVANPVLGPETAVLSGRLNGEMDMTGSFTAPLLNGSIECDSVGVFLPIMATRFKFNDEVLPVVDNVVTFNNFDIYAINKNPLTINGSVNAKSFSDIILDLSMAANNFQVVGTGNRTNSTISGKLFMNLTASATGPLRMLDVRANAGILSATDIIYNIEGSAAEIMATTNNDGVVKFVNFNDSTLIAKDDSVSSSLNMRISASLNIAPGTQAAINLSGPNKTDRVELSPSGTLNYFQNYMGDMRLNGQLNLGNGFARYSIPIMGEKMFTFEPSSYLLFNGDIMNPILNINAYSSMKTNVKQGNNSRLVTFKVGLSVTNSLSAPKVAFDLSTNDDLSVQNQLQSMSADQRTTQAMNLLLYGQYAGPGMTTANSNFSGNMLYGMLESQLNQLAARYVKGVDLSFGFDQYDNTRDGNTSTTTSYSYQLSKSLFDNRFKIMVGGKYSTDADADENFSQNLISDISFEYILKQTNTLNMSVRLFRHTGFESILEGEITEMGVGFIMKRKLGNLRSLFRFGNRRRRATEVSDTVKKADIDSIEPVADRKEATK